MRYPAAIAIAAFVAGAGLAGLFCLLAAPRKAVHADSHPIGGPISSVRGSIFASVRWLTARATQNALAALP